MNLVPNTTYTLIRQLANPTDTATYYVQAVIRNIITGKTLQTINLTNQGGQRFTAPYQVPSDTSGQGTYISICTYVFDDAGYSVPDGNYETEDKEYLIIQPPVSTYGNGGTTIVDYDKIKKFISEIKFPGVPSYDKEFAQIREYHDGRSVYDDREVKQAIQSLNIELSSVRKEHLAHSRELYETLNKGISDMKAHHEKTVKSLMDEVKKSSSLKLASEKERDEMRDKHDRMKRDYDSLLSMLRSLPAVEQDASQGLTPQERAKKLLRI